MSISNEIAKRLFQAYIIELTTELIVLKSLLKDDGDIDRAKIIDNGYLLDFSLLKPSVKISKNQYRELILIYSTVWMTVKAEEFLVDMVSVVDHALLGTILFYSYLYNNGEGGVDEDDFQYFQKKILKIQQKYSDPDVFSWLRVTAEESIIGKSRAGFSIANVLHIIMKFKIFN